MKKQILNLGKALNKVELKSINGSAGCPVPQTQSHCEAIGGYWRSPYCLHRVDYCY